LGHYENWPQRWLWLVILASASTVTANEPKEHKQCEAGMVTHSYHKKADNILYILILIFIICRICSAMLITQKWIAVQKFVSAITVVT